MVDGVDERIAEAIKLGSISSSSWQAYTWKNELAEQKRRICLHLDEILAEVETEHNPHHMLERAIGVAAVCMRRLIECRLVTDRFREAHLDVHEVPARSDVEWRETFLSDTAGAIFDNYDLRVRTLEKRTPKVIADKILHARVIGVLSGSAYLPDGLLVASDTQRKVSCFISRWRKSRLSWTPSLQTKSGSRQMATPIRTGTGFPRPSPGVSKGRLTLYSALLAVPMAGRRGLTVT